LDRQIPRPNENFTTLIGCDPLRLDQFGFDILQIVIVQLKPPPQCTVRHAALVLEQVSYL